MKILLIGKGQEFNQTKDAFLRNNDTVSIIGSNIPRNYSFRTNTNKIVSLPDFLRGTLLKRNDLKDLDSIFVSIYDKRKLSRALKILKKLWLNQPVFIISTAISETHRKNFSQFNFIPIQEIFSRQIQSVIRKCEFLFRVNTLRKLVRPKDKVLIVIFENPDPDAIASSYALKTLLSSIGVKSAIAYTGEINRIQNRFLIDELGGGFHKITDLRTEKFSKLALVDAQPYFFHKPVNFHIVIDHHPIRKQLPVPFFDVRSNFGSTSTIMTQYLINAGIRIGKKLATALLYGIKTDTNNLERHLKDEDISSFRYLFSKADKTLLRLIEHSEIPKEALPHFEYALKTKKTYKDLLYVNLGEVKIPEVHVMVADFLLKLDKISQVIVSAVIDNTLIIIFRNDGYKRDAGKLASLAFGPYGHAGGHKFMARAEISCETIMKVCKSKSHRKLDRFILGRIKKYL
jgi:nanoRNase/pAp phosphatase (c-di-AMP/oligoRNAs hydrolase)